MPSGTVRKEVIESEGTYGNFLTLPDNTNKQYKVPKDQTFMVNGHKTDVFGLRKGMTISATVIIDSPVVETSSTRTVTCEPAPAPAAPPIPLKFFGFASKVGEPKKIFLEQGEDVWIAGEGEIVDRRYKVVRISNNAVEIQDVVNSGPPQTIQLTQG